MLLCSEYIYDNRDDAYERFWELQTPGSIVTIGTKGPGCWVVTRRRWSPC